MARGLGRALGAAPVAAVVVFLGRGLPDSAPLAILPDWLYLGSRYMIPVALLHASTNVMSSFLPTPKMVTGVNGTQLVSRGSVVRAIAIGPAATA